MDEKKAFVFDTNFIIQNQDLREVCDKLRGDYTVYVTQVSIDERIAQQCRELKNKFDEAEQCKEKFKDFVTISFQKTYEQQRELYRKGIQSKYENQFGNCIIPFVNDGEMLSAIIDRANQRLPPFSAEKNASDKGFKDCLLWLSLLAYFKEHGEDRVVFVTDDKNAFRNNFAYLQAEFQDKTGKTIEIQPNAYYKDLDIKKAEHEAKPETSDIELPKVDAIREEIAEAIEGMREIEWENYFGDPQWTQTFTISDFLDRNDVEAMFNMLSENIRGHIFEKSIPASKVICSDSRMTDGEENIPIQNLERALKVYQSILKNYSQYTAQFYDTVAGILNKNYVAPPASFSMLEEDDAQLPF